MQEGTVSLSHIIDQVSREKGIDPKILIEDNERFSNCVDDSVRKYPGILDLGKLLSEHVSEHVGYPRRGGSLRNSQSAARTSAAKDRSTVHPPCAVGDAI